MPASRRAGWLRPRSPQRVSLILAAREFASWGPGPPRNRRLDPMSCVTFLRSSSPAAAADTHRRRSAPLAILSLALLPNGCRSCEAGLCCPVCMP
ncbi:hypothetical protein MTO96_015574 [Rhipicephalus appendiculatus]